MLTAEQFQNLGTHLSEIDPILDQFCQKYNFTQIAHTMLGRYPRRRIEYHKAINLCIDIQMELNHKRDFFTQFYQKIPYSITVGGWVDIDGTRYGKTNKCFRQIPFVVIKQNLECFLEYEYTTINQWTVETLKQEGCFSKLGDHKPRSEKANKETIAKQVELAKHMTDIDFVMNWFCKEFGFSLVETPSINSIKIVKHAQINFFFELTEDFKQETFQAFVPESSFTLSCGAWINRQDIKYCKVLVLFRNWPILSVKQELFHFLLLGHKYINNWTIDFIKSAKF
ncbi:hypothetical protein [Candidatus Albibeggiatoa sp. nov. NOAA]|uniref:hypothetical protein n=1 Tax=Candidatus Albibeggiatoa sp. nov. NOAA TaxID=3162724 RepID=UPI0032F8937E|nr:hypothetical protein [Thiotrichaceae bacterium]